MGIRDPQKERKVPTVEPTVVTTSAVHSFPKATKLAFCWIQELAKQTLQLSNFTATRTAQQPLHPCKYLRQNLHTESEHDQIKKKALKRVAQRECLNKNTSSVISVPMQVLTVAEKVWQVSTPTASQNARTTCGDPQPIPRN